MLVKIFNSGIQQNIGVNDKHGSTLVENSIQFVTIGHIDFNPTNFEFRQRVRLPHSRARMKTFLKKVDDQSGNRLASVDGGPLQLPEKVIGYDESGFHTENHIIGSGKLSIGRIWLVVSQLESGPV